MNTDQLTLKDVAGYCTERMVWKLLLGLADGWTPGNLERITPAMVTATDTDLTLDKQLPAGDEARAFMPPEHNGDPQAAEVWTAGALAHYALTGMQVFEGRGGETQTAATPVPRIAGSRAGRQLSTLVCRCLSYNPTDRPAMHDIVHKAQEALAAKPTPPKRLVSKTGRTYETSLVKFWPEEMGPLLLALLLSMLPMLPWAQQLNVPDEMASLVWRCIDLRQQANAAKVRQAFSNDMRWTMMDELALDRQGECTTRDPVSTFGFNNIGFGILKAQSGVTNAGGRFRDGRDPRYKYSLIEVTVKRGATVRYDINGREGEQLFAVVPFDRNADFTVAVQRAGHQVGKTMERDGVRYVSVRDKLTRSDSFTLSIHNRSGKNMAFVIINYNSRNHE